MLDQPHHFLFLSHLFSCWRGAGLLTTTILGYFSASSSPSCRSHPWASPSWISVPSVSTGNKRLSFRSLVRFRKSPFSEKECESQCHRRLLTTGKWGKTLTILPQCLELLPTFANWYPSHWYIHMYLAYLPMIHNLASLRNKIKLVYWWNKLAENKRPRICKSYVLDWWYAIIIKKRKMLLSHISNAWATQWCASLLDFIFQARATKEITPVLKDP